MRGEGLWVMYLSCPLALELDVNWMLLLMSVSHLEALAVALCMPSHIDRCIPQVERIVCVIFFFLPTTWAATLCLRGIVDVSLVLETLSLSLAAECGCLFTVTVVMVTVSGFADKPVTDSGMRNWVVNMTLAWQTSLSQAVV